MCRIDSNDGTTMRIQPFVRVSCRGCVVIRSNQDIHAQGDVDRIRQAVLSGEVESGEFDAATGAMSGLSLLYERRGEVNGQRVVLEWGQMREKVTNAATKIAHRMLTVGDASDFSGQGFVEVEIRDAEDGVVEPFGEGVPLDLVHV